MAPAGRARSETSVQPPRRTIDRRPLFVDPKPAARSELSFEPTRRLVHSILVTKPIIRFLAALATALGLIAGGFSAHLVPQSEGWWHGVTGAPSLERIGLALAAAAFVWFLGARVSVRPFLLMTIGLLPFVPATTGFAPVLLVFSGETMHLVFAIVTAVCSRHLLPSTPEISPFAAFAISFAFFALVGRYLPGPAGPQGDEPHYLLIAESLLRDGDVDLKNQFEDAAYSKFTSGRLEPHTAPRSPKDRLYAIHTPGLAVVIAPGYALLGYRGARLIVSALVALSVGLLVLSSKALFGPAASFFMFLAAVFASPLPVYANSVFPDSVATLAVSATFACLLQARSSLLLVASVSIAALPWLHPRFVPLAFLLAAAITVRAEFAWRRVVMIWIPLVLALGLLLFHFKTLFGSATLSAAYGPGFSSDISLLQAPRGATALLLDRQFGLLLFAPLLLLSLVGLRALWKGDRLVAGLVFTTAAGLLTTGGAFNMWWGGASAPSRFLVAAVPALLLASGAAWSASETGIDRRGLMAGLSGFGFGLLLLACLAPRALHNRPDGESGLLRLLAPVLDLDRFFPGFIADESPFWMALLWILALVAAATRPKAAVAVVLLTLAFATATHGPILAPFASTLRALEAWPDHRVSFGGRDSEDAFSLDVPLGSIPFDLTPGTRLYSPRFSLPSGGWAISVEAETLGSPNVLNVARVSLVQDDEVAVVTTVLKAGEAVTQGHFTLEEDLRRVRVRAEGLQSRAVIGRIRLQPFLR
jgi:hypothetical protein